MVHKQCSGAKGIFVHKESVTWLQSCKVDVQITDVNNNNNNGNLDVGTEVLLGEINQFS